MKSEIFRSAHECARREMAMKGGRKLYGTYAAAFADCLRAIYAGEREEQRSTRNVPVRRPSHVASLFA